MKKLVELTMYFYIQFHTLSANLYEDICYLPTGTDGVNRPSGVPPFRPALFDKVLLDPPCSGLGEHEPPRWNELAGILSVR